MKYVLIAKVESIPNSDPADSCYPMNKLTIIFAPFWSVKLKGVHVNSILYFKYQLDSTIPWKKMALFVVFKKCFVFLSKI